MTTFTYFYQLIAWYWLSICLIAGGIGLAIWSVSLLHDQPEKHIKFEGIKETNDQKS